LTQAFISAGAASVLSGLWSVPSGSTAQLLVSFYKHTEDDGMDKAQALRRAQMDVKEVYPHPWFGTISTHWEVGIVLKARICLKEVIVWIV